VDFAASLQICNLWQDKFLSGHREAAQRRISVKTTRAVLAAVIGAGLAFGAVAQAKEQAGEIVSLKSLPSSVQQTIKDKAAGGEIVRVKREDDANGKWNYEVFVTTNGKEWAFEVDPNGKFLKTHGEIKK
jgi:Peptidase propeptide and YPEB domain